MPFVELVLLLLAAVAVGGTIVRKTPLSLPMVLVLVGVAASFLPPFADLKVDPELFLLLFIPPILFADAWSLPRRDFVRTLRPVLLLALGLVALTVVSIGYLMHWLVPAMPLAVAFTLGAIVSPTDAVATVATTSELPLPARVVQIVNAESLLNDASGLVAFKLAVAAAATGLFSSADIALQFMLLSGGGIAMGIVVEWLSRRLRRRMIHLASPDPTVITLVTVLTPYVAYITAEWLHVSGILAVVAAGLWASAHEVPELTAEQRQHTRQVWRMIGFAMNGLVFVILGLELPGMITGVSRYAPADLALYAIVLWIALTILRMAWVFASAYLRFRLRWGWTGSRHGPDPRRVFLVGWASVRGSITLATALSVPLLTAAGTPFPERDLVVFLAAATIILTLALNGVPLPWLIRRFELAADPSRGARGAARTRRGREGLHQGDRRTPARPRATGGPPVRRAAPARECRPHRALRRPRAARTHACAALGRTARRCASPRSTPNASGCASCATPTRSTTRRCARSRRSSTSASSSPAPRSGGRVSEGRRATVP